MKYVCLLILIMSAAILMAAEPLGRVTGSGPLSLNGKAVPETAASSLPLVAGDEIVTSSDSAMIYFADKSRATIAPNSRVRLEATNSSTVLHVLSGNAELKQAEGSKVSLIGATSQASTTTAAAPASKKPSPRSPSCPLPIWLRWLCDL